MYTSVRLQVIRSEICSFISCFALKSRTDSFASSIASSFQFCYSSRHHRRGLPTYHQQSMGNQNLISIDMKSRCLLAIHSWKKWSTKKKEMTFLPISGSSTCHELFPSADVLLLEKCRSRNVSSQLLSHGENITRKMCVKIRSCPHFPVGCHSPAKE